MEGERGVRREKVEGRLGRGVGSKVGREVSVEGRRASRI